MHKIRIRDGSNDKADESNDVGSEDTTDVCVVGAGRPSEIKKRQDAHEAADERGDLDRRLKGGEQKERAEQTEQDGPVAHENLEVRFVKSDAIERVQSRGAKYARKRQQMNDSDNDEHRRDQVSHGHFL